MPVLQQAYVYAVALIAVHMVVLGVANLLRVAAEAALGAPSGGFTGLAFLFAEGRSAPGELYREHLSLAIALLLVGAPMWTLHLRAAERAATREPELRGSALRAAYLQVVIFVTALLVFAYTQSALRQGLEAALVFPFRSGPFPPEVFDPAADPTVPPARVAGALAMVLAAAAALAFHLRLGRSDRALAPIGVVGALLRRWRTYLLVVIGLSFALFGGMQLLGGAWEWVWWTEPQVPPRPPGAPPGPPIDFRTEMILSTFANATPPLVAGLGLWAASWLGAQRRTVGPEAAVELRSAVRALALYGILFVSVLGTLFSASASLSVLVRRVILEPSPPDVPLLREVGDPWPALLLFALSWWWHWRVAQGDAARADEAARGATIRRTYLYLVSSIALLLLAIGAAGTAGVLGSVVIGQQTHQGEEIAGYITLVAVGLPVWLFHLVRAGRRAAADPEERSALPRRVYLYLAILGGIVAVLVFGSAALYRTLTGVLALSFDLDLVHDVMHLIVDTAIGAAVAAFHWRVLRADRTSMPAEAPEEGALLLIARGAARERLAGLAAEDVIAYPISGSAASALEARLERDRR